MTDDRIERTKHLQALGWLLLGTQLLLAASKEPQLPKEKEADPRQLLKTVAQTRNQIVSGEMEFEVTRVDFGHPLEGTNHTRVRVVFDGGKCRFEFSTRGYRAVLEGPDAGEVTAAKLSELKLVRGEAAVQVGLLRAVDQHRVASYDGVRLLGLSDISASEGRNYFQSRIEDPAEGGDQSHVFDPRILGLTPSPFVLYTVESCLSYTRAESVTLVGTESVQGVAALHVRVSYPSSPGSLATDFWLDASHPSRVVKCQWNGDTVFSKFDPAHPEDPIPIEVMAVRFYGMERVRLQESLVRRTTRYDIAVDPASWTLAGLNMPLGTEVVDYRVHRSLGYWNGTGLSDDPPPEAAQAIKPTRSTSLAKLMELAAKTPDSLFAAHAYFSQAILLKGGTYEAIDDRDSTGAERLLQRAIAACDHAGPPGLRLATTAKEELSQLRRWGLGKVAQQTVGEDMDGQKMKLSDHRGRVVVLTFWATWCPPCMAMITEERKLVERMAGKPFSLLGVNCNDGVDLPKVKAVMATNKVTWPSFRDGGKSGPIASAWNVHNWPTIYVLDPKGVVRFRNVRGQALVEAVDALIHEAM